MEEATQLRWVKTETRDQLRRIAATQTEQGDTRRAASRPTREPCYAAASKTPLADGLPKGHALVAVVRLKTVATTCTAAPFALGAKQGVRKLEEALDKGMEADAWVRQALKDVVAGSAKGSLASAQSALRCWASFADAVLNADGNHLPPTAEGLACWSRLFRIAGTFSNYVGYLRLGCHILGVDASCSYGPLLHRAKQELGRRQGPPRKKTLWCRRKPS